MIRSETTVHNYTEINNYNSSYDLQKLAKSMSLQSNVIYTAKLN